MPVAFCNTLYISLLRKMLLSGPECGTMRIFKLKKSSNRSRIKTRKERIRLRKSWKKRRDWKGVR
jgi:hypothetical protein